jgi:hypothetical protein
LCGVGEKKKKKTNPGYGKYCSIAIYQKSQKNPIKERCPEPSPERQKGKAKERPKDTQHTGTKKKGESYFLWWSIYPEPQGSCSKG